MAPLICYIKFSIVAFAASILNFLSFFYSRYLSFGSLPLLLLLQH